jgi:hypothetical protein
VHTLTQPHTITNMNSPFNIKQCDAVKFLYIAHTHIHASIHKHIHTCTHPTTHTMHACAFILKQPQTHTQTHPNQPNVIAIINRTFPWESPWLVDPASISRRRSIRVHLREDHSHNEMKWKNVLGVIQPYCEPQVSIPVSVSALSYRIRTWCHAAADQRML